LTSSSPFLFHPSSFILHPFNMDIALYAPFKPLDHPNPSGDWVIGRGLGDFFSRRGHRVLTPSRLRTRWLYWQPWRWPAAAAAAGRAARQLAVRPVDLWLTYHCYYKAPDVLGPWASRRAAIPYVIFQGIYSTKVRRRLQSLPGFWLNRIALTAAGHVFTNRRVDLENLGRLLAPERLSYVTPGIYPQDFVFDARARQQLREQWRVGGDPVVVAAAMFRPGVKARGLDWVIRACGRILQGGQPLHLVIAGDGVMREPLETLARDRLAGRVHFVGQVPRCRMPEIYSAGDVFAFPGFRESLGMVFLEAQSCGLPVVAFDNGGIAEVVADGQTGILAPLADRRGFDQALRGLLADPGARRQMGEAAARRVRRVHDLNRNYGQVLELLAKLVATPSATRRSAAR